MEHWFGYMGKVLRVDLTNKKIVKESLREHIVRDYIGCTGYAARLLWEELKPSTDALGPENKLIFSTGPLTGSLCPGAGSFEVCTKSPLTGVWAEARCGGAFGPKLKFAGFDFIILEGRAEKPVYIWVHDGEAEIKDSEHLWGKSVHETTEILINETDPKASAACIGLAGENLVKFASIMSDCDRAAARCGVGAVMGSKNLKAIVVAGVQDIAVADPEAFYKAVTEAEEAVLRNPFYGPLSSLGTNGLLMNMLNSAGALPTKYHWTSHFETANKISGQALAEKYLIKRRACFACPIGCGRYTEVKASPWATPPHEGPEYETAAAFGSWCMHDDLEAIIRANYLCNNYGLDSISTGNMIAFAMECYQKGWLTDTDGLELVWGDSEVIATLVEKIAKREGIGNLLAEGVRQAALKIGKGAPELALHVKGLEMPLHDPRGGSRLMGLQFATSPRGCCHMHPNWPGSYDDAKFDNGLRPFGLPWPPADIHDEAGVKKGLAYKFVAFQGEIPEIMGTCIQCIQWGTEENCLTPRKFAMVFSALTGRDLDQFGLMRIAERVYNLKRCFNVREGLTRKDDTLPKRMREPVATGPAKGQAITNLEAMLDEFYEACGWDKKTGIPTREKLEEIGLDDIADELARLGKLT